MNIDKHRFLFCNPRLSVFICNLILLFSSACFQSNQNSNTEPKQDESVVIKSTKPNIDLAKSLEVSEKAEDVALAKEIDEIIDASEFANARWGIFVVSLKDGRVLVSKDGRKLFNPASTQKVLTSVVALDKLGSDFRWKTSVYAKEKIKNGTLNGDLVLYGQGSPDFDDEGLSNLVNHLKQKGLKEIKGDMIGDESYFTGDNLGDGWTWNAAQWYYGAASSALSINQNQVTVTIQDGKPRSDSKFVELSGEVEPVEDIEAIGVKRELGTNNIYVWGNGKNLKARIAISQPALLSAKILKEVLEKNGIKIGGDVKSVDWKSKEKLDVETAEELVSVESQTLAEIVRKMNKDSVNLYAELMLKTLGKKFGEEAPDENPKMQKLRGDDSAGASVITKWLTENDVATNELKVHDGSGLSRLDFVTPEAIAKSLIFASQSKFASVLTNSLPVAGQSGTLKGRLGNVSGKVLAKTGSITYVDALAGYAKSNGETLAFVIICNNQTHNAESSVVIDKIASSLVGK